MTFVLLRSRSDLSSLRFAGVRRGNSTHVASTRLMVIAQKGPRNETN